MSTQPPTLLQLWDQSLTGGLWFAAWRAALADLTPQQAAWKPAPQRHSIWEIVNHVSFWREVTLRKARGGSSPGDDEVARENFRGPAEPTSAAWKADMDRFEASHAAMRALIADPAIAAEPHTRATHHLGHDSYHLGQVMYLRGMQGLKSVE